VSDPRSLSGRRVLVTGGSSGIGATTAQALAAKGARVAVTGRDEAALEAVATSTAGVAVQGDLRAPGVPAHVVQAAAGAFGGLDVVILNAGAGWAGPFSEMEPAEIDDLISLNLKSQALLTRAALAYLTEGSHLVFVGSIAGLVGAPDEAVYSATKAGLAMLAECLRAELAGRRIEVTLVSPGVVDTAFFTRRNRPYERQRPKPIPPSRVAGAIVDCLERPRAEVVVPGWLALPARLRGGLPGLYRSLAGRFA
jgi:short-subunit dehydrogenase